MDALGCRFSMPFVEVFYDRLIGEKDKITQLDSLTRSKTQILVSKTSIGKLKYQPKHKIDLILCKSSSNPSPRLDS